MLKRLFSVLVAVCLIATLFVSSLTVNAEIINKGKIEIDKVSAITGDTVVVPVRITDNPGIMAITISITYNSKALTYEKFLFGEIVNDYTVVAHPDKNIIRFVNCESRDRTKTGALLYLQFKVNDDAEAEFHEINIKYSAGDFCNWNLDKIMPEIVAGGVDVAFNGNNCSHKKYDEWTVAAKPSCDESGLDQRICKTCGHIDLKETAPIGHEYSENWTIDKPATKEEDGTMTRYCIRCDDYVDRITFSLENADEGEIKNEINVDVPNNSYTEELFKEQNPDKELTVSKPAKNDTSNKEQSSKPATSSSDKTAATDKPQNTQSKESDSSEKGESEGENAENNSDEIIEDTIPESEDTLSEEITVIDKIKEVFSNFETIMNVIKVAGIALLLLVI